MIEDFVSIGKKIVKSFEIAKYCRKIVPLWNPGYLKVFSQASRICRLGRFEPAEAFRLGLFKPGFDEKNLENYTSRKVTTKLQKAVNPQSWEILLKNKGLFYRYLMSCGLPVPELYAIFFKQVPGWSPDGKILAGRKDWEQFFENIRADEFIIKPCTGAFGEGFKILTRKSGEYKDTAGNPLKTADIYELMKKDTKSDSFIIQQRLHNHPEICRLNPSDFLQTVRTATFIDRSGTCRILFAYIKLISGCNITDNIHGGLSGNMFISINVEDGKLGQARHTPPDGKGPRFFDRHAQTGIEFEKFKMPLWPEISETAKKAAFHFLPVRTIGWDIAVTAEGIKIIEGNVWWNPLNLWKWKDVIEAELPYEF